MKIAVHYFLVWIFLNIPFQSKSNQLIGGEITWKYLRGDTFDISLTLYRDCNGVNFGPISIGVISTNCQKADTTIVNLKLANKSDITPVCPSSCSSCNSSTCNFGYGIEKYEFKGLVVLSDSGCCEYNFVFSECCSRGNSGSPPDFYLESSLNKCLASNDISPVFSNPPLTIMCQKDQISYDPGIITFQDDSIFVDWTYPLVAHDSNYSFPGSYDYNKFLNYSNSPNPIPIDSLTGKTNFKPLSEESDYMAYRIKRYKNGKFIGQITRDHRYTVIKCSFSNFSNSKPTITGIDSSNNDEYKVCLGDTVRFKLYTDDADKNDKLKLAFLNPDTTAYFTIDSSNKKRPIAIFEWVPTVNDVGSLPSLFRFKVEDDVCPKNKEDFRTIRVFVNKKQNINITVPKIILCDNNAPQNLEKVSAKPAGGVWQGDFVSNQYFYPKQSGVGKFTVKYIYKDSMNCSYEKNGTVEVLKSPELSLGNDTSICIHADTMKLHPSQPILFWVNSKIGVSMDTFVVLKKLGSGTHQIIAVHSDGACSTYDTLGITIYDKPSIQINPDTSICLDSVKLGITGKPLGGTWKGDYIVNDLFDVLKAGFGVHVNTYSFKDVWGCMNSDSFTVTVLGPKSVDAGIDTALCMNAKPVKLSGNPKGGEWSGDGVKNEIFDPEKAGNGIHKLIYKFDTQDKTKKCESKDSIEITVNGGVANFSAEPVSGKAPLKVFFDNLSKGNLHHFLWNIGNQTTTSIKNPVYSFKIPGKYDIQLIGTDDSSNCVDTLIKREYIEVIGSSAIAEQDEILDVVIYPNPAQDRLYFEIPPGMLNAYKIIIYDVLGNPVIKINPQYYEFHVNISKLHRGVYLIGVENKDTGQHKYFKWILN